MGRLPAPLEITSYIFLDQAHKSFNTASWGSSAAQEVRSYPRIQVIKARPHNRVTGGVHSCSLPSIPCDLGRKLEIQAVVSGTATIRNNINY